MGNANSDSSTALLKELEGQLDQNSAWANIGSSNALPVSKCSAEISNVETLLAKEDVNINCRNEGGRTPLQLAVVAGRLDIVEMLLKYKKQASGPDISCGLFDNFIIADVNAKDINGVTALRLALARGLTEITRLLLEHNADPDQLDGSGEIPLTSVVLKKQDALFDILCEFKANLLAKNKDGKTLLHAAVKTSNLALIDKLLKLGADVNARDDRGTTPLLHALEKGTFDSTDVFHFEVIEKLVKAGADLNSRMVNFGTALHLASDSKKLTSAEDLPRSSKIVELLLKHGADVNAMIKIDSGETPLHNTSSYHGFPGGNPLVAEALIKAGADVNAGKKCQPALFDAVLNCNILCAELLLKNGADATFITDGVPISEKYRSYIPADSPDRHEWDQLFEKYSKK